MPAAAKKKPWEKKRPANKPHHKLSAGQKRGAKASAKKAGRKYPSLVDNMNAAKKKKAPAKHRAKST